MTKPTLDDVEKTLMECFTPLDVKVLEGMVVLRCRCKVEWVGALETFIRGRMFSKWAEVHMGPGHGPERRDDDAVGWV